MPTLVFDCETIPDIPTYATLLQLPDTTPLADLEAAWTATERPFKPALQRIISLAAAWITDDGILQRLRTLGPDEPDAIQQFFQTIAQTHPVLTGWNTSGFDVPVLLTRALVHHIPVGDFYTIGMPYEGYLKRYGECYHRDLMDLQAHYGATSRLSLDEMATLLGIPGKLATHGDHVSALYQAGALDSIHAYCQHDVLTTAWVYARMATHRGWWNTDTLQQFEVSARSWVTTQPEPHWADWITAAEERRLWH